MYNLSKMFSRPLPDWHKMNAALENSVRSADKKRVKFEAGEGKPFTEFARKQPEVISDVLFRIDEKMKQSMAAQKQGTDAVPKLQSELMKLRPLNDDIRAKRKDTENLRQRAQKSTKAAEAANTKVSQLASRGTDNPDYLKAASQCEIATRQKETDIQVLEEREKRLVEEEREYKKQFFLTILNALGGYANDKGTSCASLVSIGDQLAVHGSEIPMVEDSGVEVLQTQLQALRSETLE